MSLLIFTGPMWCGKTTMLHERIWEVESIPDTPYKNIFVGKSSKDLRDPEDVEDPHYRTRHPRQPGEYVKLRPCEMVGEDDLLSLCFRAQKGYLTVLDEAMLFERNLLDLARHFLEVGEGDLWLAGLEHTSEGEDFGEFAQCFEYAHQIIQLRARCNTPGCLYPASMTHHQGLKTGAIEVGDANYSPRCWRCWDRSQQKAQSL